MMSVKDVQEMLGVPLLGAIPEDTEVIVSTNRGEPLVLKKKLTLAGIATKRPTISASKISSLISTSRRRVFSSAWASSSPATKSDRVVETPSHSRATDVFNRQMCYYNNSYSPRNTPATTSIINPPTRRQTCTRNRRAHHRATRPPRDVSPWRALRSPPLISRQIGLDASSHALENDQIRVFRLVAHLSRHEP